MAHRNFWQGRENINNRPSVERLTVLVINHIMDKESIAMGIAMEKLMKEVGLWDKSILELKDNYPDII